MASTKESTLQTILSSFYRPCSHRPFLSIASNPFEDLRSPTAVCNYRIYGVDNSRTELELDRDCCRNYHGSISTSLPLRDVTWSSEYRKEVVHYVTETLGSRW